MVLCMLYHSKIEKFKEEHAEEIGWLLTHFRDKGIPYQTVEDLLVDMLDDVIDVWIDSHRKNDSCLDEELSSLRDQDRLERESEDKEWVEDESKNMEEGNFSL